MWCQLPDCALFASIVVLLPKAKALGHQGKQGPAKEQPVKVLEDQKSYRDGVRQFVVGCRAKDVLYVIVLRECSCAYLQALLLSHLVNDFATTGLLLWYPLGEAVATRCRKESQTQSDTHAGLEEASKVFS